MVKVFTDVKDDSKRKRYNKNKKKAWRKKTQINDVEEKLEEERREERYGGPLEEREDKEFMFIDTGEDPEESEKKPVAPVNFSVDIKPGHIEGFKPRTKKVTEKPLRSHQFLKGFQGAKTPHKEKTTADKHNAATKHAQNKLIVEAKKKNLPIKDAMRLSYVRKKRRLMNVGNGMLLDWNKDNWASDNNHLVKRCKENGVEEDFIEQVVGFHSTISGERAFNVPGVRFQKTSSLPAVRVAEAGQSYNPTFEDHQVLLEKAVRQQGKIKRISERYVSATTKMFPTIDKAPTEMTWLAEMSEGLPTTNDIDESEDEEEEEEEEEATITGKRTTERKTQKQRKKEFKRKFKERKQQLAKERRKMESDVFRIKTFNKEIAETERVLKNRQAARKAFHEQKKGKPLRLGKLKFVPEDIAVSLGTELKGSLRLAKPTCNLLDERFKHLQRRNIIEPRVKAKHPKSKHKKAVMKKEHKLILDQIEKGGEIM